MARFWKGGADSSESESEASEVEQQQQQQVPSKFVYESSDDEQNEEKRVVRSEKDKRLDELRVAATQLKNSQKINDWNAITTHVDRLEKVLDKSKKIITQDPSILNVYLKALLGLEDFMNKTLLNKALTKKMNRANHKALTAMKQRLAKQTKKYQPQIEAFKASGLDQVADDEAPLPAAQSSPEKKKKPARKEEEEDEEEKTKPKEEDDDDDDDDDMKDDDDSGSDVDLVAIKDKMYTREFWMKTPKDIERERKRELERQAQKGSKKVDRKKKEKVVDQGQTKREKVAAGLEKDKAAQKAEVAPEAVQKKLREIIDKRGRRGTDHKAVIVELRLLATKAKTALLSLKIKLTLIGTIFDSSLNRAAYMGQDLWRQCHAGLMDVIAFLRENPSVRLAEEEDIEETVEELEEGERDRSVEGVISSVSDRVLDRKAEEKKAQALKDKAQKSGKDIVTGNLYSLVSKLAAEFTTSLQNIDHHTAEYIERLRDEKSLIELIIRAQGYYENLKNTFFLPKVILLRLEYTYYHYKPDGDVMREHKGDNKEREQIETLASYLYKHGKIADRTQAVLLHIYHHCIHNRFPEARDLLLMSHVQTNINDADMKTRILFNRMMAQLGLCAFRIGEFRQALSCLAEFYPSPRIREFLAQGVSRSYVDRDAEKEQLERRRQYPFHMHINIDMIEAFHLLSALFDEIPNMAMYGAANKKRIVSKIFRHHLTNYQRQVWNGPPENTRDAIICAAAAMRNADFKKALKYIWNLRVWDLVPNTDVVKARVKQKLQEVALRTYLLTYGTLYSTIKLDLLHKLTELEPSFIIRIVSEMIYTELIHGALDEAGGLIILYDQEPTRLQREALVFAEKAALFVDQYDKLLGSERSGGYYDRRETTGVGSTGIGRWGEFAKPRTHGRYYKTSYTSYESY